MISKVIMFQCNCMMDVEDVRNNGNTGKENDNDQSSRETDGLWTVMTTAAAWLTKISHSHNNWSRFL
jgi:prophage maintenance system killer protein